MRDARPLLFIVICKPRILSLRARFRPKPSSAITGLHAQTCCKDKLANSRTETTEEGVEGLEILELVGGSNFN
jgi:hypothetical protein